MKAQGQKSAKRRKAEVTTEVGLITRNWKRSFVNFHV